MSRAGSYGARVNSTSGELKLAGPGVAGDSLESELTNEGFKRTALAWRCRALTSDEVDESEIYEAFVAGGEGAVRGAICKADCASAEGQEEGQEEEEKEIRPEK